MIRRKVYFSGRVQGVGFRYTASRLAQKFAISGYVKNLPDGRVEAVMEGEPPEIERFQAAIAREMSENITGVSFQDGSATGEDHGFDIRF